MKEKLKKQLRLIDDQNEFDDDELEMMIDDGDYQLFDDGFKDAQEKRKVLGELETRKEAMQKLEQDMQKLYELFAEIALLVEHQGEQVDDVMANVINTEAYVEKANEDVKKAVIYQSSARKKKICITIVCIILLIIGALIALWQLGVFNKQIQQVTDFIEDNTGIQIDSSNLQGSIDIQQEIQDALNQL